MASTQSTTKTPNFGRRIKWLGITSALVAAIYSGGWYWLANEGEKRLDAAITKSAEFGRVGECVNRDIKGYPFRLGLFCDKVAFSDDERGIVFNAGALRTAAQVYNPRHVVVELDGPAFIETQDVPPLEMNWSLLHGSVRAAQPLPKQVSVEGEDVKVASVGQAALSATYVAFHMRTEATDVALAGQWDGVTIAPDVTPGRTIPPYAISYDILVKNGVDLYVNKTRSLRGQSGEIRGFNLTFADGGTIKASGPVFVNSDGLVSGEIKLAFTDAAKLGVALSQALPEAASAIGPALGAAGMAAGADKEAALTLTIRDGKVSAGLFPLGEIPPLQ